MPNNTVDIYFKGHDSGLTRTIREMKAALTTLRNERINIKVDVDDRAITRLQDRINSVRNGIAKVNVAADTAEIARVRRELAALRDRTVHVDVEVRSAGALAELAAFDQTRGNARMALDLDTAGAAAELAAFLAAVPRNVTINVDLDTATAAAELAAFRIALLALNSDTIDLRAATRGASTGIARMGGSASSAGPLIAGLALAIAPLASGAVGLGIYGTAAALGVVTAGAGAMAVAFGAAAIAIPIAAAAMSERVKEHFSFMKNDVIDTMKEIAKPVEQPLVDLATAVGAAFHQIRPSLDFVTAGAARLVNELSGKMPAIAAEAGPALEKMFAGAEPHIKNLIGNIPSYIAAFGRFAEKLGDPAIVAGAQRVFGAIPGMIDGAGDALVTAGEKFNQLMGYLDAGNLDGFTSGIGDFINDLQGTDWSGVTAGLADMANAFGEFVAGVDTQNLATNIEGLATFAADVTRISGEVVTAFQSMDEAFRQSNESIGGGPTEWGAKAADSMRNSVLDSISDFSTSGMFEALFGDVPDTIPSPALEPPDTTPFSTALDNLPVPDAIPTPPLAAPDTSAIGGALANLAPGAVTVPIEPAPMPPPEPPVAPVEIKTEATLTDISQPNIPPLKVPVEYDTSTAGTLTLQAPEPIKVPVEIIPPPPPDMSAFTVDLTAQGAAAGATFAAGLAGSAGAVAEAANAMAAAAQNISVDLSAQGSAAGASFAAGIRSQAGAVASAAAELGRIAAANKGHYKGRRGIAADRIMLIPHGQAMVAGFIGGMQSQHRELISAAQSLATDVYTAFDDDLVPNIGLSGGMGITQKVYVQVEAGVLADPVKIGREITSHLSAYSSAVGQSSGAVVSV